MPGSANSTMNAMPASFQPSVARKVSRFCTDSQSTIEPRKPNIQTSAMRDRRDQHRVDDDVGPGAARIVQAEGDQRLRRLDRLFRRERIQSLFEPAEHVSWHSIDVKARAALTRRARSLSYRSVVRPGRSLDRRPNRGAASLVLPNIGGGEPFAENRRERCPQLGLRRPARAGLRRRSPHRKSAIRDSSDR